MPGFLQMGSPTSDVTHSPWKKPSPAQGLLPPSHQIKPPAGGNEGEETLISTALSSVFNQTLTRDYLNAEVMKHSQPQLFQVSSVLFPHHPVLPHFHLFTSSELSPKATPESGLAFPEFSKCFPACGCIFFLHALSYPCILSLSPSQDVPAPSLTCAAESLSSTAGMASSSTSLPPY